MSGGKGKSSWSPKLKSSIQYGWCFPLSPKKKNRTTNYQKYGWPSKKKGGFTPIKIIKKIGGSILFTILLGVLPPIFGSTSISSSSFRSLTPRIWMKMPKKSWLSMRKSSVASRKKWPLRVLVLSASSRYRRSLAENWCRKRSGQEWQSNPRMAFFNIDLFKRFYKNLQPRLKQMCFAYLCESLFVGFAYRPDHVKLLPELLKQKPAHPT